jgi:hypothetical protein
MFDTVWAGVMRRPLFLMSAAIVMIASGCYSTSYSRQVAANTDLISELADKLLDYARTGFMINDRQISSEEMGEFYYAAKKAHEFARATEEDSRRASYRDFAAMLATYGAFLHSADECRLAGHPDAAKLSALISQHDAVEKIAARVRADLSREED